MRLWIPMQFGLNAKQKCVAFVLPINTFDMFFSHCAVLRTIFVAATNVVPLSRVVAIVYHSNMQYIYIYTILIKVKFGDNGLWFRNARETLDNGRMGKWTVSITRLCCALFAVCKWNGICAVRVCVSTYISATTNNTVTRINLLQ